MKRSLSLPTLHTHVFRAPPPSARIFSQKNTKDHSVIVRYLFADEYRRLCIQRLPFATGNGGGIHGGTINGGVVYNGGGGDFNGGFNGYGVKHPTQNGNGGTYISGGIGGDPTGNGNGGTKISKSLTV